MIELQHLTKTYGEHAAVSDLTVQIGTGQIYGFLGPNGAGKSTTMNIMAGCLAATEGTVTINGYDILEEPEKAKRCIGYLPEQPPLYLHETPAEYLRFVGEAKGLRGPELTRQVDAVLRQTGTEEVRDRRISALSKGYRQRVGIAQALLGEPQIIILDEPTVGLDPIQIIEIRDLIKALGRTHTVIFSSHILSEVQAICDQILIIAKGKLVAFDTAEQLKKRLLTPNILTLVSDSAEAEVMDILNDIHSVVDFQVSTTEQGFTMVQIQTGHDEIFALSRDVFLAFSSRQAVLLEMSVKKADLEAVFLELTEAGESPDAGREDDAQ